MMTRRRWMEAAGVAVVGVGMFGVTRRVHAADDRQQAFLAELKRLEHDSGGRLGVALLDTGTGSRMGCRTDERFAMCSTFKLLVVGAVLSRLDAGKEDLERRIRFERTDLVAYSPITEQHTDGNGLSVAELCAAAITHSDNTAANLLVASLGGTGSVTTFARSLGDPVTRLDRVEPGLNEGREGDVRDTTTPIAMTGNLQALVLGKSLTDGSRARLTDWLIANTTGDARLRAGLPAGWRVGDKTGSGSHGTANDIAVIWPTNRAPVILAVYLTQATVTAAQQSAIIASVGRAASTAVGA